MGISFVGDVSEFGCLVSHPLDKTVGIVPCD